MLVIGVVDMSAEPVAQVALDLDHHPGFPSDATPCSVLPEVEDGFTPRSPTHRFSSVKSRR
jgi:hypothetical protein